MKFIYYLQFLLLFPLCLLAKTGQGDNNSGIPKTISPTPLEFIENKGQWEGHYLFRAETGKGDIFLLKKGFAYLIGDPSNTDNVSDFHHGLIRSCPPLKFHSYVMSFEGANDPEIVGGKQEEFYYNYFIGSDPERWKTNIHPYLAIDYRKLYNGVNVHISSYNGNMKYELQVSPGADVSQVRMSYKGQDGLKVKKGDLVIETSIGEVTELKPYAYQYINDTRIQVNCNYSISDNIVTYAFPDGYDKTRELVIDPTVVFATFSGSTMDNWGYTATYDEHGNFYNGGIVHLISGTDTFIVTPGAYQTTYHGGVDTSFSSYQHGLGYSDDIGIVKYNSSGSTRIWATYLGGTDNETPHSMIVDANDNLIVVGRTYSRDFPHTSGAYQTSMKGGNCDMYVTKFNASCTALIGSTFIGGSGNDGINFHPGEFTFGNLKHNYGDDARSEVLLDKSGNVYVAAETFSSDFPTTTYAYQTTNQGGQDGVLFKMNANLTSLIWSTYIGGSGDDAAYVLDFDTSQRYIYVSGGTQSSNFPSTTGTLHPSYLGHTDGYILKFQNSAPYTLQKGTFIGTADTDQCYGIQVDLANRVYVVGQSLGGHFPVSSGVYTNPHSSQFVQCLDSNLATSIFSTVFGTGDSTHTDISPVAFLVDTCQNIYISGWGGEVVSGAGLPPSTGSTTGLPVTSDAAQKTTDGRDFYFIVFNRNAAALLYATFMGGTSSVGEHVDGGTSRFDKYGIVYQAICGGCGGSSSFPTTSGAWSTTNRSLNCNEIALKIAFELGDVVAKAHAFPNSRGCLPFTVNFGDSSVNAISYLWTFGDGGTDTTRYPTHTFTSPGSFTVRLVIYNPKACKTLDTDFLTIFVDTTYEHPGFTTNVQDSCGPYVASFTNSSIYSGTPGSSTFTKFEWFFGDTSAPYWGTNPPTHTYSNPGTYTVMMIMIDSTACNSPDTLLRTLNMNSVSVSGKFTAPDSICVGASVNFVDSSHNATGYSWVFGDGGTSSTESPQHTFDSVGVYTVVFVALNPASCNGADTFKKIIKVMAGPIANFSFSPSTPQTNMPTTFTNLSVNATRYAWVFGDGDISSEVNPVHLFRHTGTYNVCLYARNSSNCPSYLCRLVGADVKPLADLPNAFSPNGDGANDVLYVRGTGIQTMDLKIYNRWGQLIFESNDQNIGWDGTYNGQPQPMEAYAYVLNVTFIDNSTFQKKGNVTLLR